MMEEPSSFRDVIVERLQQRNRSQSQINNYVTTYKNLVEEYKNLSIRLARQQIHGQWSSSPSTTNHLSSDVSNELLEEKRKVKIYEQEIDKLKNDNNILSDTVKKKDTEINRLKQELKEEIDAKGLLHDDYLELNLRANILNEKLTEMTKDYSNILDQYNKLKIREVEWYNVEVERENQRQREKMLQEALGKNIANRDDNTSNKEGPLINSGDSISSYEYIGDDQYKLPALGMLSGYDLLMNKCVEKQKVSESDDVTDIIWSKDGDFLYTSSSDKILRRFKYDNEKITKINTYRKAKKGLNRLDICEDKGLILGASNDTCTYIWNISNETVRYTFTGHTDAVMSAKFFDLNKKVASGGRDRVIKIWDLSKQQIIRNYLPGTTILDILDATEMASCFLSGHVRKEVHLWDERSPSSESQNFITFEDKVTSLHEVPGTMQVLCSIADETLSLIDIRNMMELHSYSAEQFRISSDHSKCTVSPNGRYIATGSANGLVFIWNIQSTKLEKILPVKDAHEGAVVSIAWHPLGNYLATGDKKQTVCIWGSGC
ncbi:Autophagy-related protein 16-2 [Strongyloides ratti]|uniref:Autophagy-related protein 16-2 n=1 Tax=Strongyloides ratti TaxID=34506 RepID=A0A090LA72_STRRB|nr:Autophagy-related protein 16-2 [Strongyloides ratti]CEF66661.1 Autophagy-related protein 16-2 [Strongyloides ratti]